MSSFHFHGSLSKSCATLLLFFDETSCFNEDFQRQATGPVSHENPKDVSKTIYIFLKSYFFRYIILLKNYAQLGRPNASSFGLMWEMKVGAALRKLQSAKQY